MNNDSNSKLPAQESGSKAGKFQLIYLLFVAGMGGLLTGVDFGIIAGALLYLDKTISLTESSLSFIVAVYAIGGIVASLFAGIIADLLGRKKMLILSGLMFIVSILLIYTSDGFIPLLAGRVLMGLSGGALCVVVPLYMAESLPAEIRGRGTALFQFMLALGIVSATLIGLYFANRHDLAVEAAAGNVTKIFDADDEAWRFMFLVAAVPGIIFTIGAFFVKESPRWLMGKGREEEAESILSLSRSEKQTALEMDEMRQHGKKSSSKSGGSKDSLFQRKYILPFALACIILVATQATGINTIIAYSSRIFQGAGMDDVTASQSGLIIMSINALMTLVGVFLVDRVGRKRLLTLGTAGVVISLIFTGLVYRQFEAKRIDVTEMVSTAVSEDGRNFSLSVEDAAPENTDFDAAQLNVLYRYDDGAGYSRQAVASAFSNAKDEQGKTLNISPLVVEKFITKEDGTKEIEKSEKDKGTLSIIRAQYGPVPSETTGWLVTGLLCLFICSFSMGPGVCVWLALTELMPTRIRSTGMGIAMVLNSGVQFLFQWIFLPVVGNHGFHVMFFIWAGCTVIYFITAAFFLPETKGKTLEEIEDYFEG